MKPAALPADEAVRLAALQRYQVLDTPAERPFDRLTELCAKLLDVPIALISLVDEQRQWFKSRVGLSAHETPREVAFCSHAILGDAVMMVPDALADPRFSDNPLVTGDPNIRAYLGAPLRTPDGQKLGTLCAIDRRPRSFSADQVALLETLSALAMDELELRFTRQKAIMLAERNRRTTAQLQNLLDQAPLAIFTLALDGTVTSWNRASERIFGFTAHEAIGHFLPTVGPEDRDEYADFARKIVATREPQMVQRRRHRKDGTTIPIDLAIGPLLDASGEVEGFMTIAEDVSERHRLEESLRLAAHSDPMTGLANRRGFVEASGRELARAARTHTPLSFVLFDIDHFKQVNDRFGHSTGDRVLEAIAETLRNCLRASDLGVRWGGDELLAMLPDTGLEGARLLAERVRSEVARLAVAGAAAVTLSAGVAQWQIDEAIVATLSRADERLYRAKTDGRDRVC